MQHSLQSLFSALLGAGLVALAGSGPAVAQSDVRRDAEPSAGLSLPGVGLAGEHDAFSVAHNPAGLGLLHGLELGLGMNMAADDGSAGPVAGLGFFAADVLGGGLLPRVGLGLGLEVLRPDRDRLAPDPGTPIRLSMAAAVPFGRNVALGLAWRRFYDDPEFLAGGLTTWDLGVSGRLGPRLALGAMVRDLTAPRAGTMALERRYELEMVLRPTGTDRLELAAGGSMNESRNNLDGWVRAAVRLGRGVYVTAQVTSDELGYTDLATGAGGTERELVATGGLTISLGKVDSTVAVSGVRRGSGGTGFHGSAALVRARAVGVPSVFGSAPRIERLEISGSIGDQELTSLVLRMRAMARDPGVKAVLVSIDDISAGWATVRELRQELLRLRDAGKAVFVYMVAAETRDYYLASAANKIYLDPAGGVRLTGFAGTTMYYKGLFDSLGVAAEFEKIEEYKSAPEAWTRQWPSEAAQRVRGALYDSLYATLLGDMAKSRGLAPDKLDALIDGGPYTAGDLENTGLGLVDAVVTPDEVGALVIKELGAAYGVGTTPAERPESWSLPAIAVIYIEGDIIDGKSQTIPLLGRKLVGGETIVRALIQAREDPAVKAIVLRIDSPGGSALASELMAREVFATRGVKPIICSMGDVAASGGYFAAAGCDVIFAEPTTITGSIGIFYGKFDFSGLLSRLGITWATEKRGARADMDSYFRPYTAEERVLLKDKMRYLYNRFVATVARGRGLTEARVDELGRGRVWTGEQAREVKLVDELGGLGDAIVLAKARVGLGEGDRARVIRLPGTKAGLVEAILGFSEKARSERSEGLGLPGVEALLQAIPGSLWVQPGTMQARLPFAIIWE